MSTRFALVGSSVIALIIAACAAGPSATPPGTLPPAPVASAVDDGQGGPPTTDVPVLESMAPDAADAPSVTVEESGGFRLTTLSSAACTADGPGDWLMTAPDKSDRADLLSPDGSLYAGYGIQAINTALQAFAGEYPPPMNDPALYSDDPSTVAAAYGRVIVGGIGGSPDLAVDELYQPTSDYLLMTVVGSTHRGVIFFRAAGFPGDGYNYSYALPMYFAFTTSDRWDREGLLVARVAASIRCSTQLQPPDDYPIVDAHDDGAADANGDDAGYNPQLGTEEAHDPTTGENYLVDPSVNWSETGPDGPGYYVPKSGGNDYQRLDPGRSD
jgi:hypothetical protein